MFWWKYPKTLVFGADQHILQGSSDFNRDTDVNFIDYLNPSLVLKIIDFFIASPVKSQPLSSSARNNCSR